MTLPRWRYTFASVTGSSHRQHGEQGQDACDGCILSTLSGEEILVAVAADGAGSAPYGAIGAQLTCQSFITLTQEQLSGGESLYELPWDFAATWLGNLQETLKEQALLHRTAVRDFACTCLAAIIYNHQIATLHIGDGAIVVARRSTPDAFRTMQWPESGEYINTTYFITDPDASTHLRFSYCDFADNEAIDDLAIFTDGLQRLALDYTAHTAYPRFFQPVFAPLHAALPGYRDELSKDLARFLSSSAIATRTDDDCTLFLASRRNPPQQSIATSDGPITSHPL